jgi:ABC-type sugar transport system ATPase subunit
MPAAGEFTPLSSALRVAGLQSIPRAMTEAARIDGARDGIVSGPSHSRYWPPGPSSCWWSMWSRPRNEITRKVEQAAVLHGLDPPLARKPRQLSGGQRQRVAMGRAIVRGPKLFLFDEPLSNLDAKLRVQMRAEIHKLQRRLGVTSPYVTHDQVEAMRGTDADHRSGRTTRVRNINSLPPRWQRYGNDCGEGHGCGCAGRDGDGFRAG